MSKYKKELIKAVATALKSYGYTVFLSKNQEYGFYTNGKRVVTFGGQWNFSVDFSGSYKPSAGSGTGWRITADQGVPAAEDAREYITANAPAWTGNANPIYTTPEQHLATYGSSSGFSEFTGCTTCEAWRGQGEIEALERAGYVVTSVERG